MRALIIGGDGLLGSHLVRKLLNASYDVRVLVQPNSDSPTLDDLPIEKMDGDLLDGPEFLAKAMQDCQVVFHVAAITNFWAPKDITWKVNYDGTLHVLEAIKKSRGRQTRFRWFCQFPISMAPWIVQQTKPPPSHRLIERFHIWNPNMPPCRKSSKRCAKTASKPRRSRRRSCSAIWISDPALVSCCASLFRKK